MDKIVITGIGMASRFADSAEELYNALKESKDMSGAVPMLDLGKKGLAFTDSITKSFMACMKKPCWMQILQITIQIKITQVFFSAMHKAH